MAAHAKLSASGAHRWYACPGSVAAEQPFPDDSSAAAREGSAAHELGEAVLKGQYESAFDAIGQVIHIEGEDFRVTKSMAEYVQWGYVDYIQDAIEECDELIHVEYEQRVNFGAYVPDGFGTSDAIMLYREGDKTVLHVVDLKYGHNPVDPENNLQGILYALGALDNFEWLADEGIDEVRITICQPRVFLEPQSWYVPIVTITEWGVKLRAAAHAALKDDAPRVPGEDQCKYCRARFTCGARRDRALEIARFDFNDQDEPITVEGITMPAPSTLSLDDIANLLPHLDSIVKWAKDVQEYAYAEAMRGQSIKGFKLVDGGRKTKQWKDEAEIESFLLEQGFDMDEIYESKLVSPAKAEKLVGKALSKAIADYYEKVGGKTQLVPESDKREAINVDPAADFD